MGSRSRHFSNFRIGGPMTPARTLHFHFREAVTNWFRVFGNEAARVPAPGKKISESILDEDLGPRTHIAGVPGFSIITVAAAGTSRIAQDFDRAQEAAAADENRYAVLVHARRDHPVSDALAVMKLSDFAALVGVDK